MNINILHGYEGTLKSSISNAANIYSISESNMWYNNNYNKLFNINDLSYCKYINSIELLLNHAARIDEALKRKDINSIIICRS